MLKSAKAIWFLESLKIPEGPLAPPSMQCYA